jgi:hypothetical protein
MYWHQIATLGTFRMLILVTHPETKFVETNSERKNPIRNMFVIHRRIACARSIASPSHQIREID